MKRNPWWTKSTNVAKNRKSMWYGIWKSSDKPRVGHVYLSYKFAKTKFCKACREAFTTSNRNTFKL